MQKHTFVAAPTSQTKTPAAPVAPSVPQPIDPNLLRYISGGVDSASAPYKGW